MPEEPGQEKNIKKALSKVLNGKFEEAKFEPIAFGLVAVIAGFTCDSIEGVSDKIEAEIKKIPNVSDVTVERMSLV